MAFWNEASLEPKRKFKFLIDFGTSSTELPSFIAKKCDKPSFDISESPHDFLGHRFYYPGKVTWKEVSATVIDPAGSSTAEAGDANAATLQASANDVADGLYKILIASGYQSPTAAGTAIVGGSQAGTLRTMAKGKATRPFNQIRIIQVDDQGKALETWVLNNAWIKSVNFGGLDYSSDEINEIGLTFRYDWADLEIVSTGFKSELVR